MTEIEEFKSPIIRSLILKERGMQVLWFVELLTLCHIFDEVTV